VLVSDKQTDRQTDASDYCIIHALCLIVFTPYLTVRIGKLLLFLERSDTPIFVTLTVLALIQYTPRSPLLPLPYQSLPIPLHFKPIASVFSNNKM
jgi:hypothetical protein